MGDLGGEGSRLYARSFADKLRDKIVDNDIPVCEPTTKYGRSAIILTNVEVARISMPYKHVLIFKFYSSHLPTTEVQDRKSRPPNGQLRSSDEGLDRLLVRGSISNMRG